MRRKEVSRRITSVAEVRASKHAHRGRVGAKFDERPAAQSAGALSKPYFDHMDGELATIEQDLITAEDAHVRNLIRIVRLRRESSELTAEVYEKQTSARQILVGTFGSESAYELAAASGDTPRVHQTLAMQVDQTVKLLRDPAAARPPVKVAGVTVEPGTMADDLEGSRQLLLEKRTDLQRTEKAADGTRDLVNIALKEYDQVFPWVASSLESTFRLVGEQELADRIRTSRRRVTRRQAVDDGESLPEESTSGEPPAEESAGGEPSAGEPPTVPSEPAEATPPPSGS